MLLLLIRRSVRSIYLLLIDVSIIASSAEQTNGKEIYQSFKVSAVEDL
jgi:hypothetical protein